jgi:hypothetical protein
MLNTCFKINAFLFLFILYPMVNQAQENVKQTLMFEVTGEIRQPLKFRAEDLGKWKAEEIGNVVITNHLGEPKGTAKDMKGVKIKDLLAALELNAANPRQNSTFYFVFTAVDGYKVVYSWNELFNSPMGEKVYIVTSKEGKSLTEMSESMLVVTPSDYKTGRRYIKGLASIDVRKIP